MSSEFLHTSFSPSKAMLKKEAVLGTDTTENNACHLPKQYQSQLQILSAAILARCVFLHLHAPNEHANRVECLSRSLHCYSAYYEESLTDAISFETLRAYLATSNTDIEIIDTPVKGVFESTKHALIAISIKSEKGDDIALLGAFVCINQAIHPRTRSLVSLIAQDISAHITLRQQLDTLQHTQARDMQISELNQDFICVSDNQQKIVYANEAFLNTFPQAQQNTVIGSQELAHYDSDLSARLTASNQSALTDGIHTSTELVTLANGEEKILNITKKPFEGADGDVYILSVSRDVTEKEILINDLKRSNADLDNFAYVASHDLKSPLNVIKRLVTWVDEDCADILPPDSKENLALVLNRVSRMEKLLVDLLSYSRIGKDYQESIQVNVKQVVVELLSLIDLPMGFSVQCESTEVCVPEVAFNVVMLNLINNAIKHHDSGNARIEIKAKQNTKGAVISILDNGPGIEPKDREKIFKLFETLKPRDEIEGSGMGLSVVKKIVEHYGGHITVDSNKPRGTKFSVHWPMTNIARTVLRSLHE